MVNYGKVALMKILKVLVLALLLVSPVVLAAQETFTTGKEWNQNMSENEKFMSLAAPMILFNKYGVPFKETPEYYIPLVDKVLTEYPYLENEDVANIFASTVYAYEPESRETLTLIEKEFTLYEGLRVHRVIKAY